MAYERSHELYENFLAVYFGLDNIKTSTDIDMGDIIIFNHELIIVRKLVQYILNEDANFLAPSLLHEGAVLALFMGVALDDDF